MTRLDDAGEKKLEEHFPTAGTYSCRRNKRALPNSREKHVQKNVKSKANCRHKIEKTIGMGAKKN